ncbi:hypothetical protein GCM10007916_10080 [Psychromonas marina]|uniref:GIY-YIG domain-containing protein n=1 Tax=Psychromonas marina TaxID=88364 RepID=A0ABQ6DYW2_9GAMM|nr:GIY-YIG nuclease family protein [Psychromonas marina]GLS89941.1 hypothetical protein GCM10007916_10080 [Psychromonas marina]
MVSIASNNEIECLQWVKYGSLTSAALMSPTKPGVYALCINRKVYGLSISVDWGYIGRSDKLNRRLTEHLPKNEKNDLLKKWIFSHYNNIEVWVATTATKKQSRLAEKELVRELNPTINKIKFTEE